MNRRQLLSTIGVGLAAPLAGCGDQATDDGSPTTTPAPEPSPTDTSPTATATRTLTATLTPTATPTATPVSPAEVVDVGDGEFRFDPGSFEISTGETVLWVWRSTNHNVVPDSIPDGSNWTGTEGGSGTTYERGHESAFRFTTPGEYTYFCAPHRSAGMTGSFTVVE